MGKYLMVLNDGETFTDLQGCHIIEVPDDWDEDYIPDDKLVRAEFTHAAMMIRKADLYVSEDTHTQKVRIGIRHILTWEPNG